MLVASRAVAGAMIARSFVLHYRRASGMTAARAIERIRVEAARQVLEQGLPVKRVAARLPVDLLTLREKLPDTIAMSSFEALGAIENSLRHSDRRLRRCLEPLL